MSDESPRTGKWQSGAITDGPSRAAARAMLRASASTATPSPRRSSASPTPGPRSARVTSTCASSPASVKDGIRAAGGTPMEFNTVSISDGITMGSAGMRASLVSREVIADSIELVARGNLFDALVVLVGCDKTIPGGGDGARAARRSRPDPLRRVDRPRPGQQGATSPSRTSSRPSARTPPDGCPTPACASSKIARARAPAPAADSSPRTRWRPRASSSAWPPMGSGDVPATDPARHDVARTRRRAGDGRPPRNVGAPRRSSRASRSRTRSPRSPPPADPTNAVLHLIAIAREAGVPLDLDDFDRVNARVPLLADLKPGGRFVATDLHARGRHPAGRAAPARGRRAARRRR